MDKQPLPGTENPHVQPGTPMQQGIPKPPGMPMNHIPKPPGTSAWMQRPEPIPGIPSGLEYLSQLDGLQVKQKTSLTEVITGFDTNNKYVIMNQAGQQCYFAEEESDTCQRICCGPRRAFNFKILDNHGDEVIKIWREFKCCAGCQICAFCCDCAAYEVFIEAPVGMPIGYVKQTGSFWRPKYDILDENHEPILKIVGPRCILDGALMCVDNKFRLESLDGTEIGSVKKKYSGFVREIITTADNFGMTFPQDLSVKAKASLLGALLLIDFMFFENPQQQQGGNRNMNAAYLATT